MAQEPNRNRSRFSQQPRVEGEDPRAKKSVNIDAIDDLGRTIDIKRGFNNSEPHPNALISYDDIHDDDLRDSLFRLATWVADNAISGPALHQAARDLLLRKRPPALTETIESLVGEDGELNDAARNLVRSLAEVPSVLRIQGPLGSGKTNWSTHSYLPAFCPNRIWSNR